MAMVFRHLCSDCGYPVVYKAAQKGFVHTQKRGNCQPVTEHVTAQRLDNV